MPHRIDVFISSTTLDLAKHRLAAREACMRLGMFPLMMEYLPASDATAVNISLKLANEAEIYVAIIGWRYGFVPSSYSMSMTELEYRRAFERRIPRLVFMSGDIEDKTNNVDESDLHRQKLDEFRSRLKDENIVNFFSSPEDLRAQLIHSLSEYRDHVPMTFVSSMEADVIPRIPERFIAHPYALLQTKHLYGRRRELELLNDWLHSSTAPHTSARVLTLVGIGGMGKSALTWAWFNELLQPHPMFTGMVWWSFYDPDSRYENFILRTLAYVSQEKLQTISNMSLNEREDLLIKILNQKDFLIILDGVERLLVAYARADAERLADDDLDIQTANRVARALDLPESAAQSFTGQHRLRKASDVRVGNFLRKAANLRKSRILISSRLFPADLQTEIGQALAGTYAWFMTGLRGIDALELWRALGVSGSGDKLLPVFESFDYHPLLIHALAGEVARFRRAPGDFDLWLEANPNFNPFNLPLTQRKSHVLEFALQGLTRTSMRVLETIALFRMPAPYDFLIGSLLKRQEGIESEVMLDSILTELEDRGLIGWDRKSNRYDIHPIVRGVAHNLIDPERKRQTYQRFTELFESIPAKPADEITSLDDLLSSIEQFNSYVGMEQYDDAYALLHARLQMPLYWKLGDTQQLAELLVLLFPSGLDAIPPLTSPDRQIAAINLLANCYLHGEPGRSRPLYERAAHLRWQRGNVDKAAANLTALSYACLMSGALYDAEYYAATAYRMSTRLDKGEKKPMILVYLALCKAAQGKIVEAQILIERAISIVQRSADRQTEGVISAYAAHIAIANRDILNARKLAARALTLSHDGRNQRDTVRAARVQGIAALHAKDFREAENRLRSALTEAHAINYREETTQIRIGLAELYLHQQQYRDAHDLLEDVWETVERGPYPLIQTDALIIEAYIAHAEKQHVRAQELALNAYHKAVCDGYPYCYDVGLQKAIQLLQLLNIKVPPLPSANLKGRAAIPAVQSTHDDHIPQGD
jgi:hypothetical protein